MVIDFGKKETTEVIDSNGSTKTNINDYRNGELVTPRRVRYEVRTRVSNVDEERKAISEFSDLYNKDRTMLDAAIMIERSIAGNKKGYYYVVKCHTVLEY